MAELILERNMRLALRADAHHLEPMVLLGANGFTESVLKEIDRALGDHGLVKVHVPDDDRELRESIYLEVADKLNCARIQNIGKMLVFWREPKKRDEEEELAPVRKQFIKFGAKADPGAKGMKKPLITGRRKDAEKAAKKGRKVVLVKKKTKRVTKKSAMS